jgi:hypothetical protein
MYITKNMEWNVHVNSQSSELSNVRYIMKSLK